MKVDNLRVEIKEINNKGNVATEFIAHHVERNLSYCVYDVIDQYLSDRFDITFTDKKYRSKAENKNGDKITLTITIFQNNWRRALYSWSEKRIFFSAFITASAKRNTAKNASKVFYGHDEIALTVRRLEHF